MKKKQFLLVSFNDENMEFEHKMFNSLYDAQSAMRKEVEDINEEYIDDSYIGETSAWMVGDYTKSWKIIEIEN